VRRAWGNNPWKATTVLHVAITRPEDRYEGTIPNGKVTISSPQTLRLIANIRPTGTTGNTAAAQTILRFGSFFVRQVARAYLSRTTKPAHPQAR
jgi:hypothetical protein